MARFDFGDDQDDEDEVGNSDIYLKNPEKSLELIRVLLDRPAEENVFTAEGIQKEIFSILAGLDLERGMEYCQRLAGIGVKWKELDKLEFLDGKVVLGVGGRFSAGKSCFINSIAKVELPEDQRETTAIATYVVRCAQRQNIAYTANGNRVVLEDAAVKALTHQFYNTYRIGFSRVIKELVICSPEFPYENIAIIDTPGYNKADSGKLQETKDVENARRQLQTVDYLIWLVDIENGTLKIDDREFIENLNLGEGRLLIVFNKAGLVSLEKASEVIESAKAQLEDSPLGHLLYGVIAYDSKCEETIAGGDVLGQFLSRVNQDGQTYQGTYAQFYQLGQEIVKDIAKQAQYEGNKTKHLENAIADAVDVGRIQSLISECARSREQKRKLLEAKKVLNKYFSIR